MSETSIAHAVTPDRRKCAKVWCNVAASGVVRSGTHWQPGPRMRAPEINPGISPAADRPASMKCAVLVLPLVPVTPNTRGELDDVS